MISYIAESMIFSITLNFCFSVDLQLHHGHVMSALLNAALNGIFGIILVFISCELGQRMGDAFEEIGITIGEFDWYLFPIKIQRMLPMIIADAQQPVEVECFGSIACTRETFRKVVIE